MATVANKLLTRAINEAKMALAPLEDAPLFADAAAELVPLELGDDVPTTVPFAPVPPDPEPVLKAEPGRVTDALFDEVSAEVVEFAAGKSVCPEQAKFQLVLPPVRLLTTPKLGMSDATGASDNVYHHVLTLPKLGQPTLSQ